MDGDSSPLGILFLRFPLLFLNGLLNPFTTEVLVANFFILILIICSAAMSASEIAYFSLSPPEIDELKESDNVWDKRVARLMEKPRYMLSTLLITNNIVNIGVVILSYYITKKMFNFHDINLSLFVLPGFALEFIFNVVIVTFFLVLFGEVTPKIYATQHKLQIARGMSGVFSFMMKLYAPINIVLISSTQVLERKIKKRSKEIDIEEINKAIEITVENKSSKQDARMLKGIVHFGNITVRQIMRPRIEVSAIDSELNFEEMLTFVKDSGYSRLPVFKESLDHVIGVLHIKDLLEHINQEASFNWQKLMREPLFVHDTKKIDDLLREFQHNRKHLGIVVDEYGGTSGIITLEDVVEEVLGDIKDEFDEQTESDYKKINDFTFIFDGKISLIDLCRALDLDTDYFDDVKGDSETISGLILELMGKIPQKGEEAAFQQFKFLVLNVINNRIEKVKTTVTPK